METLPEIIKEINQSEAHKALFEYNLDAIFMVEVDGKFMAVNSAAVRMSGYSTGEFDQLRFSTLVVQEENARFSRYFADSFSESQRFETVIKQKQGCLVEVDLIFIPIVLANDIVENIEAALENFREIIQRINSLS